MLPCHHHAFQRTDCPLPSFLSVFSPALGLVSLLQFEKISFPSTSNGRYSSSFFLDLHPTTQSEASTFAPKKCTILGCLHSFLLSPHPLAERPRKKEEIFLKCTSISVTTPWADVAVIGV